MMIPAEVFIKNDHSIISYYSLSFLFNLVSSLLSYFFIIVLYLFSVMFSSLSWGTLGTYKGGPRAARAPEWTPTNKPINQSI